MHIEAFFDSRTWTLTYLVWDPATRDAVVIDPVLDYDPLRVRTFDDSLKKLAAAIDANELKLHYSIDTHAHADHISGGARLREKYGCKLAIGAAITTVQETFKAIFKMPDDFAADGREFDALVPDGGSIQAGSLTIKAIATPGHTPACVTWQIGDCLFTGDTMFMPDFGTGRCDFPHGSAALLYDSIQKLYGLPPETRVFVGHDYQPGGRELRWETSIGASRTENIQLKADTSKDQFVEWRTRRDATLSPPNLIFQSIQCNIRAGDLPDPDNQGRRFICMPMGVFGANS